MLIFLVKANPFVLPVLSSWVQQSAAMTNAEKASLLGRYHLCVRKGEKEKCENKASSDSWAKLGSVIRKKLSARTFGPELVPNMPTKKPRGNGEEEASN